MKQTLVLREPVRAHESLLGLWKLVKPWLICNGTPLQLEIKPQARSNPANRLLHASIGEIAAQLEWAGEKRDAETWKRLLVAAWCRVRGVQVQEVPALDGKGFDIVPARTSKLTPAECSDLQEFIFAWGVDNGVRFSAPEDGR